MLICINDQLEVGRVLLIKATFWQGLGKFCTGMTTFDIKEIEVRNSGSVSKFVI
jgi:hypothetical protein